MECPNVRVCANWLLTRNLNRTPSRSFFIISFFLHITADYKQLKCPFSWHEINWIYMCHNRPQKHNVGVEKQDAG